MAFFVVQRDADSGLSIPLPDSYPTREAAIAALSSATASGALSLTGEVFIADLGTAVPVLLMAVPAGRPADEPVVIDEPAADPIVVEIEPEPEPQEAGTLDEQAADEVYSGSSILGDEQSLAAALKRAASSLEDEGIVAPASVDSAPEEPQAVENAGTEWPWANVEAYTAEADEPEPESEAAPEPEAENEPVAEPEADTEPEAEPETDIEADVAPEPEAEPAAQPEPEPVVEIVPESDDETPLEAEGEADSEMPEAEPPAATLEDEIEESPYLEAPAAEVLEPLSIAGITDTIEQPSEPAVEDVMLPEDLPIITSAPTEGEDVYVPRPVILGDYADVVEPRIEVTPAAAVETDGDQMVDLAPAAEPAVGYEAQGAVDFEEYTCQDCVYANTCPKVGEATPANCGSFQWRSE